MTWTKTYTASQAVNAVNSDGGTSLIATIDELIQTWLPSRGWTTTTAASRPSGVTGAHHWWVTKEIELLDGSSYEHRQQIVFVSSTVDYIAYERWEDGVAADTVHTYSGTIEAQIQNPDQQFEGTWEFWVSDQDDDSFAIICRGLDRYLIGFFPPHGSLIRSTRHNNSAPPAGACPVFPSPDETKLFYNGYSGSLEALYSGFAAYSTSGMGSQETMINCALVNVDSGTDMRPAFLTGTNDISMVIDTSQANYLGGVGTLQVGSDFYIKIGGSNKLLLHTGTTDPGL